MKEILPQAKKDVRPEVICALGVSQDNADLLLSLAQRERGKNRDAALEALAKLDGEDIEAFWKAELAQNEGSVDFLQAARTDWAGALVSQGLTGRLENFIARGEKVETKESNELSRWLAAMSGKTRPTAVAFWRWTDERLDAIAGLKNNIGQPVRKDL